MPISPQIAPPRRDHHGPGLPARNHRRLGVTIALALCLCTVPTALADLAGDVSARVRKLLEMSAPKNAAIGIQIVALGDSPGQSRKLFSRAAEEPMIPASNLKLLTTAAALDTLGKDFKFQTQLLIRRDPQTGAVELAVIGDGDPSFGDAALLKNVDGWGTRTVFAAWAQVLRQRGITKINALLLDDSVFDQEYIHPSWPANQRHQRYEAQVGGLNLNTNCLDVHLTRDGSAMRHRIDPPTEYVTVENTARRGGQNAIILTRPEGTNAIRLGGQTNAASQGPMQVTVHDPSAYFGTVFAEVLREAGIDSPAPVMDRSVRGAWREQQAADAATLSPLSPWHLVAVHQTEMPTVLARTNKDSVNMYAEALAKRSAFAATGEPGSWPAAEQVVKDFLGRIGMEAQHVRLDDASGLSRHDRVTAAALCDVLTAMHHSDAAGMFRDSLSEAGVDGTLQKRFKSNPEMHRRVFGKTGYINGVCTFSGYLHGRDGRWYAFSILVNNTAEIWKAQQLQEQIILALDRSLEPNATTAGAR